MNQAIQEIEHHLHNIEVWIEPIAVPVGGTNEAVVAGTRPAVAMPYFQVDAGNSAWGSWVCVLGSGDTPAVIGAHSSVTGFRHYDMHKIGIQTSERSLPYWIQIGFGTVAAPVLTGQYTTVWFNPVATTGKSESITMITPHVAVGTQAWVRALCPGQNTATVNFNLGLHFYID
jgi:hypothetical protein